jgi:hypothetical protein
MTFDEYFANRVGKGIDYDGNYGVQCFDLANDFSVRVVGGKQFVGMWAYEIYTNYNSQPAHELYQKIQNTPDFVPKKGDIIVWSKALNGRAGHVAVCTGEGNTSYFYSYDQNWTGKNDPVTKIKHDYRCVLGVLRPKDQRKILGNIAGDVNGDGKVNVTDVSKVAAHIKGEKPLKTDEIKNADINKDGKINVADLAKIAAKVKGQ